MIRTWRIVALLLVGVTAASCAPASGGQSSARPADLYAIVPTQANVRTLMGDSTWWGGPPSFEVLPLNAQRLDVHVKFGVFAPFLHLGTDEQLGVRYTIYDKSSSASSAMSDLQAIYSGAPTTPKVGDQVVYTVEGGMGGAPFRYLTFVRSGQVLMQVIWTRKDHDVKINTLAKVARAFVDPLKNLGKVRATPTPVDPNLLPPPGLDITMLGSANLPLESITVMLGSALPDTVYALLKGDGATTFAYGDYALNNDTHMEVQTAVLQFPSSATATEWATNLAPGAPDDRGIASGYVPVGSTPAAGVYRYVFAQGSYVGIIICKSSISGEAASRECEDPSERTALGWKAGLAGVR